MRALKVSRTSPRENGDRDANARSPRPSRGWRGYRVNNPSMDWDDSQDGGGPSEVLGEWRDSVRRRGRL